MDALSSQANLAGYRAVIEGRQAYGKALPMMMTAAGTIPAAKVFIMGVGVAGCRPSPPPAASARWSPPPTSARHQGAGRVARRQVPRRRGRGVQDAQTAGGYAKEMSAEYQAKQAALTSTHIAKQDIVITTALIPGRPAPKLISAEQVASMRPGSVIVDLAVEQGGNCAASIPGEISVTDNGVTVVGLFNLPGRIAADASALYSRNLLAFTGLLLKDGAVAPDMEDEILKAALLTQGGAVVHPALAA
jgi:NAD(P) transhydrogenase subunit alpha